MAVVINEFEVIPNEPTPKQQPSAPQGKSESELQPQQVERLLERERNRSERVWAH